MNVQTAITSTPRQESVSAEARVVLKGVSWETFKALLADIGEDRSCRLAYDQGMLEIMVPYEQHEEPKILIAEFITASSDEYKILRAKGILGTHKSTTEVTKTSQDDSLSNG